MAGLDNLKSDVWLTKHAADNQYRAEGADVASDIE